MVISTSVMGSTAVKAKVRIKVNDLSFYYGSNRVLKNITMDIFENKVTAIIGPSGCGKSTFIRIFNRMNDLIDGFAGFDLARGMTGLKACGVGQQSKTMGFINGKVVGNIIPQSVGRISGIICK